MKYYVFEDIFKSEYVYLKSGELLDTNRNSNYVRFVGKFDLESDKDIAFLLSILCKRNSNENIYKFMDICNKNKDELLSILKFNLNIISNGYNRINNLNI